MDIRGGLRGDRGAATAEAVLATPLLLLLVLGIVQFAVWAHATHIAQTAAAQALNTARAEGATAADGHAQARALLAQLGHTVLTNPHITVTRSARTAQARVSGRAEQIVPWLRLPVRAAADGPVERWTTSTEIP